MFEVVLHRKFVTHCREYKVSNLGLLRSSLLSVVMMSMSISLTACSNDNISSDIATSAPQTYEPQQETTIEPRQEHATTSNNEPTNMVSTMTGTSEILPTDALSTETLPTVDSSESLPTLTTSVTLTPISTPTSTSTPTYQDHSNDNVQVTPDGYGGLSFGQTITPELIKKLGFVNHSPFESGSACYYLTDPTLSYTDARGFKHYPVSYQIINGRVALISIRDASIPFYTGIGLGDTATDVMSRHNNKPFYPVNIYDESGEEYDLVYNINFDILDSFDKTTYLTVEDVSLHDDSGDTALQIAYVMENGVSLGSEESPIRTVHIDDWTPDLIDKLTGEVSHIEIGTIHAISLAEGCA